MLVRHPKIRFHSAHSSKSSSHGFALIIALGLMAFLVMLMLSLGSLILVENQSTSTAQQQIRAQENARLALSVALGELQKYTGPDQRITGTAGLLDTDPDTTAVDGINQPYWTGVWDKDGNLLTWLVSGNTGLSPSSGNFVTPADDMTSTPARPTLAMYTDDSVTVPLTEISDGAYAYWISDEGVKANANLAEAPNTTDALVSAQKMDVALMTDLAWLENAGSQYLERAPSVQSLKVLASSVAAQNALDTRRHDLTTGSYGLLTNTVDGGLKQDLTLALYDDSGMPTGQMFEPLDGGMPSLLDPGGPQWLQLQSWATVSLNAMNDDGSLDARPGNDDQTGISPVITQVQFYVVPRYGPGPSADKRNVYIHVYPAITLWNPYDRALKIQDGKVDLAREFWDYNSGNQFRYDYPVFQAWRLDIDGVAYGGGSPAAGMTLPGASVVLHFNLGNIVLQPGESVTFSAPGGSNIYSANSPLSRGFDLTGSYYFQTPITVDYDPSTPDTKFILKALRTSNQAVRLRDGDDILQEVYQLGGFQDYTAAETTMQPVGSADMAGSVGLKAIRNFTEWETLGTSSEGREVQWLAHLNPRGTAQGAIPYYFYLDKDTIYDSHVNNPSFFSAGMLDGNEQQLGLNNVGNGLSVASPSIDHTVLFEGALDRSSLQSIGQLMHAPLFYAHANRSGGSITNTTDAKADASDRIRYGRLDNYIPAYAVGNSQADPSISLDALYTDWVAGSYTDTWAKQYAMVEGRHYDYSYLLNRALWDQYFFSTLPGATSRQPENPRLVALDPTQDDALASTEVAAQFVIDGAFNVNSTSEEAWRALLGAFYGEAVNGTADDTSPILRIRNNPGDRFDPQSHDAEDDEAYHGYRALTQDQISNLAHQIVKQVKWRQLGRNRPFTSMADFVNRDPDHDAPNPLDNDAFRLQGALSAALLDADNLSAADANELGIDATEAKINTALQENDYQTNTSTVISGFATEAMEGWRTQGLPGWLTQADLLERLGPVLTVRSDTFLIRVYGESRDPLSGEVNGRAWGEATVQRLPEFVDPVADNADADVGNLNSPENETFGRRYVVTAFRWISES
jgi:hypothetical protein